MDVVLKIGDQSFANVLSTYEVSHTPEYEAEFQTLDRKLHKIGEVYRTRIRFTTFPVSDHNRADAAALRARPLIVRFTDTEYGAVRQMEFVPEAELSRRYGIKSVLGDNYYLQNTIQLVAVEVDNASNIRSVQ